MARASKVITVNVQPAVQTTVYAGFTPTVVVTNSAQLQSALASATPGAIIGVDPGVYSGTTSSTRWNIIFTPAASGTASQPIRVVAKYPAALNQANSALWSELRNGAATASAVIGSYQRNYHEFIGFYLNWNTAPPRSSNGCTLAGFSTGTTFKYFVFDQNVQPSTDNYNSIYTEASNGLTVQDCVFRNPSGGSHNDASITTYGSQNFLIENNDFISSAAAVFVKGSSTLGLNSGTIRFNRVADCVRGFVALEVLSAGQLLITQNLIYGFSLAGMVWDNSVSGATVANIRFVNNTIGSQSGTGSNGAIWVETWSSNGPGHQIRDNVIVANSAGSQAVIYNESTPTGFTISGNVYHSGGSTNRWYWAGSNSTTVGGWQTLSGATSETAANPLFVNAAANDYRLQAGSPASGKGCYITGSEQIGVRLT